jgi:hypothetical protein
MENKARISLIINANKNISKILKALDKAKKYFAMLREEGDLILVIPEKEKPFPNTVEENFWYSVINLRANVSLSSSFRDAVKKAKGDYIVLTDLDFSTPLEEIERFLRYLRSGEEVVVASRRMGFSQSHGSWLRVFTEELAYQWTRFLGLTNLTDASSSFRAMDASAAKLLYSQSPYSEETASVEVLLLARKLGLRVVELPTVFRYNQAFNLKDFRNAARFGYRLLIFRLHLFAVKHKNKSFITNRLFSRFPRRRLSSLERR